MKVTESKLRVGGAVIFWRLASASSQPKLYDAMAEIGHVTMAPPKRQLTACLRDAMNDSIAGHYLVRPLAKLNGFAIVQETRGDRNNSYSQELSAWLDEGDGKGKPELKIQPSYTELAEKVRSAYVDQQDILRPAQVGGMLTKCITFLGGTTLREMGGIYWLEDSKVSDWLRIAEAAEMSATSGETCCYLLRNIMDEDAVRAVKDAIVAELQTEGERLHKEIMSGELGKRALSSRQEAVNALRQKALAYESILDSFFGDVRKGLDVVEEAAAAAVILAAGQEDTV